VIMLYLAMQSKREKEEKSTGKAAGFQANSPCTL
jgi:hypothetical protein